MKQPLYKTIMDDLILQIDSGALAPDSQLPTEKELSDSYQVSRITSKRALTELEQKGLIYRVRGKGSFVKPIATAVRAQTKRILFLLPFAHDLSVGNFNVGLEPLLKEQGYSLLMGTLDSIADRSAADLAAEFDGMIYYADNTDKHLDLLFALEHLQFPCVILDKRIYEVSYPTVLSDNFAGGRLSCEYLLEKGHRKIAYLFGDHNHPQSARQRYLGYLEALRQRNISYHTPMDEAKSCKEDTAAYLITQGVSAVICENDFVAIDTMRKLRQAGQQIPDDISVIGFDDIQAAALIDPPLTTIAQDFQRLGELAAATLLDTLAGAVPPAENKIAINLIKRQSVKEI